MNIAPFSSHATNATTVLCFDSNHTRNTVTVLRSYLVGNAKRLHLPRFNGFLSESDNRLLFAKA